MTQEDICVQSNGESVKEEKWGIIGGRKCVRSGSCVSSSVSLKSDQSKENPLPNFREKRPSSAKSVTRDDHTGDLPQDSLQPEHDELQRVKEQHKTGMKNKYERLFEGINHGETQINMRKQKYEERDPEKLLQSKREVIVKLAEVAFRQLMKGNVMFYEEDLIESGIDVTDASVYSGICTEIFKEESVIHQRKVYSFIHLSFQEFLAAFFVFYCHLTNNREPLRVIYDGVYLCNQHQQSSSEKSLCDLLGSVVFKAVSSSNGHLDLFLRFLLGVSIESNQRLFQDLLTHTEESSENIRGITLYIIDQIKTDDHLSAERSINLFLCLLEVKDQTLAREICNDDSSLAF
nr:protein NLRC3-like [Danio rerio]|eukprot:XP_021331050.1 protein NLRC3-like [Danio rerio]